MARGGSRRRIAAGGEHESMERWLLTYSDMITLLLALFVVLFSISSVNISKFISLQESLRAAFSGSILDGGRSILNAGSDSSAQHSPNNTVIPALVPITPTIPLPVDEGAQQGHLTKAETAALLHEANLASQEQQEFLALEHRINAYAKAHGWSDQVKAQIEQRGLVVTVLTDRLLFATGQATLQPASYPLLDEIAVLISLDTAKHPVDVEGYTDDLPIHTAQFPSNWELSTARATTVLEYLLSRNVPGGRLHASGYADHFPVASNATADGRTRNRRVEVVFERKYPAPTSP
jgi:chemotaxis protein MotB